MREERRAFFQPWSFIHQTGTTDVLSFQSFMILPAPIFICSVKSIRDKLGDS